MNITNETNKGFDPNKGFDAFKTQFEKEFSAEERERLFYGLCRGDTTLPYNGIVVQDNSVVNRDSYGSEDSTLEYIVHFEDYDTYVNFCGARSSYGGAEFYGYKNVIPKHKTVVYFE